MKRIDFTTAADIAALAGLAVGVGLVFFAVFGVLVGVGAAILAPSILWLATSVRSASK